jgi:hypothetical protein
MVPAWPKLNLLAEPRSASVADVVDHPVHDAGEQRQREDQDDDQRPEPRFHISERSAADDA